MQVIDSIEKGNQSETNPLRLFKKKKSNLRPPQEMEVEFAAEGVISTISVAREHKAGPVESCQM